MVKIIVEPIQTNHELLNIKKIIQFGKQQPELYKIQFYKSVHEKDVLVKIRALSNYEYDVINIEMYSKIKDPNTIKYVFDIDHEEELEKLTNQENIEEQDNKLENEIEDIDLPESINQAEILIAYMYRNVLIVYNAMKDFYPNLTIEMVEQMDGINQISKRVNELSGRTKEIRDRIKFFREQFL